MFSAVKPVIFKLDIEGFPHDLQVVEFRAKEALNRPYEVKLELVSERPDLDLDALLHRSAFLRFGPDDAGLHGQVYQIAQGDSGKRLTRYQMTLVPRLAYLTHSHNQRIFQHQSVPKIIEQVLKEQGILADTWRFQLSAEYRPRLYCVQYETDLHFLQRLCEEEGLHFHFQHSAEGHVLVFGDDQTGFPKPERSTEYRQASGTVAEAPVIDQFKLQLNTRPTHVSRRDYDFEKPDLQLDSSLKNRWHRTLRTMPFQASSSIETVVNIWPIRHWNVTAPTTGLPADAATKVTCAVATLSRWPNTLARNGTDCGC